ncbi:hypothetical protein CATMIT_01585, partial [Catenibacterium mitsuokai DSM 15897]
MLSEPHRDAHGVVTAQGVVELREGVAAVEAGAADVAAHDRRLLVGDVVDGEVDARVPRQLVGHGQVEVVVRVDRGVRLEPGDRTRLDVDCAQVTPVHAQLEVLDRPHRAEVRLVVVHDAGDDVARDAVDADAVVLGHGRVALVVVLVGLGQVQREVQAAPLVGQRDAVANAQIPAAGGDAALVRELQERAARFAVERAVLGFARADHQLAHRVVEAEGRVELLVVATEQRIAEHRTGDRVLDVDLPVVQGDRQVVDRLPHQAEGLGVGFFRAQDRIAAEEGVGLAGARLIHAAELVQDRLRHAGGDAQLADRTVDAAVLGQLGRLAGVDRGVVQAGDDRLEQLVDVRGAGRALEHAAEAQRFDRRPLQAVLVAAVADVGLARLELAVAVAGFEVQALRAGLAADDRDDGLDVGLTQGEAALHVRVRAAGALHLDGIARGRVGLIARVELAAFQA